MTLRDGPAKGSYAVKRAPVYLRAVVSETGETDVLDQLEDKPSRGEAVSVYRRVTEVGHVHVRSSIPGASGFYVMAEYEHMPEVDGEALRDNEAWRAWAEGQQQP